MIRLVVMQVHRFSTAIFPSEDDDVVTSPYNSVLALQQVGEPHTALPCRDKLWWGAYGG